MKEEIIRAATVVERVDAVLFQNTRQVLMELLQILIILGIRIIEDAVKGPDFVNDVLPASLDNCHVFLVVPARFFQPLQHVRMRLDNRVVFGRV